ncbi:NAD-dependent epimerase/dehydratase family protein [Streptomyces canus]|uniref:NAD-dependent epimerase/dehydratase family protein n=1 Tax=Streptomyces canus TaxID=58343 RepID=UPI003F53F25F
MKIVVVGGTGRIGSQVVSLLQDRGHEAVAAAPSTDVDTLTGEGLAEVLKGADVVVGVANSSSRRRPPSTSSPGTQSLERVRLLVERAVGRRKLVHGADATAPARPAGVPGPRRDGSTWRCLRAGVTSRTAERPH